MRAILSILDAPISAMRRRRAEPSDVRIVVTLLLSVHAGLLVHSAVAQSPTMLEPAFLASGLAHWKTGRFQAFSVNPPLARLIGSLPVIAAGYEMDWRELNAAVSRPEFGLGVDFATANRDRTGELVSLGRFAGIPISLCGAWCCYRWSQRLWRNSGAGLLSLTLWVFEPILTGHAALITADGPSTSLAVISGYTYWSWLTDTPSNGRSLLAGLALGAACATKFTLLLLGCVWLICVPITCWAFPDRLRKRAVECVVLAVAALGTINAAYAFSGAGRRLSEIPLESRAFQSVTQSQNQFLSFASAQVPIPVPADYVAGIDLQIRDMESRTEPNYAHGQWRSAGWWYFYIYAFLVKCSPGLQLLLLLALAARFCSSRSTALGELILLLAMGLMLLTLSSQTSLNRHFRYALPIVGLGCVLAGRCCLPCDRSTRALRVVAGIALGLTICSGVSAATTGLAYFNPIATLFRPADWHLIDSNLDWGQDLNRLAQWRKTISADEPVYMAHFHRLDPRTFDIDVQPLVLPEEFSSVSELPPGYYVISVSLVRGMAWYGLERPDGTVSRYRHGAFLPFLDVEPMCLVGSSLKVFYVPRKPGDL